jgi:hypothetical protein
VTRVTTDLDDPARFAALIAPVLDRAAIGVHLARPRDAVQEIRERHGVERLGFLLEFRNPVLAGVPIPLSGLHAVVRYPAPGFVDEELDALVGGGLVTMDGDLLVPSPRAQVVVDDLVSVMDHVVNELWAWRASSFGRLQHLLESAIDGARDTGGAAFAVQTSAPVALPGRSDAFQLWNHLWPLRYHRADAHAAAWAADGLTAPEVATMEPGERRDRIEVDTNRRAAAPWAALTADERLDLLAGLGALPGAGEPTTRWPGRRSAT